MTPSVINTADAPEHRLPWKFVSKNDAGEDSPEVRFYEIKPPAEPEPIPAAEPIEEGPEKITPDYWDNRIGMREYNFEDADGKAFCKISSDRDANDHWYILYQF